MRRTGERMQAQLLDATWALRRTEAIYVHEVRVDATAERLVFTEALDKLQALLRLAERIGQDCFCEDSDSCDCGGSGWIPGIPNDERCPYHGVLPIIAETAICLH